MEVRVELLTGSVKGKRREAILVGLLTGDIHILIGTQAVIEDTVNFASLGLVVIDEQHRFGVAQRARLWTKNVQPPHVLVMTATPIPRTLAMTLYGDLDVSVIDELPPGRKPIVTLHQFDSRRISLYQSKHKQIAEGRHVYIVYPLIKESEISFGVVLFFLTFFLFAGKDTKKTGENRPPVEKRNPAANSFAAGFSGGPRGA